MRIGVNLLNLSQDKFGGVEQYLKNLIAHLAKRRDKLKIFLFLTNGHKDVFPDDHEKIKKVILKKGLDNPSAVYKAIRQHRVDLWFCPLHRSYLPHVPVPTVVTIHDVLHTSFPEYVHGGLEANNRYYKKFSPCIQAVLTVSKFSKKGIAEHLHIPAKKIHAIYPDASDLFHKRRHDERSATIKAKYNLPDDYAFYPASYNPHKNHLNLLKALLILRDRHQIKIPLVLTGYINPKNKTYRTLVRFLNDHDLKKQVKILGYIPPKDMPFLYFNAGFLVFPSLFEGFGFPLVEAMNTQTPIICSKAGSIPEIVGDAALFFDPQKPEDIALKMQQALHPDTRKLLIRKGRARTKMFSWERNAVQTLKVFQRVVGTR
ncbi:glycosyltransferase family 4 protein [Paenibacillus spongiae]|uniref:Glycosyltransferase family 4 protein n=1 Tax=Paenibacillus spongiae TaxID=2909671 RepID=A0ABY5S3A1_9BACL|nr:glycosyltransferase family 1 protein [Paenibacillus spongiae]UVI28374.1 glycosyltransferase family 4 protein [Paenibacillus spongiae]